MERYFKNKKTAILISICCMALWGTAIPLIKSTYRVLEIGGDNTGGKILVAGIRFFLAGCLGLFYYALLRRGKPLDRPVRWKYVLSLSMLQTSLQYLFYYVGISNTEGVKTAIIQASGASFVVLISALVMREDKLTARKLMALVIGTLGILVVNFKPGSPLTFSLRGEGAVLVATMFGAGATVYVRKSGRDQDPALVCGLQFLLGSLPLIVIGLAAAKQIPRFNLASILMLLYGGFVSATAFSLWSMVLKYQSSGEFGIYRLFIPIFGALFSVMILGEHFTANLLAGMLLVLLSSLILNSRKRTVR